MGSAILRGFVLAGISLAIFGARANAGSILLTGTITQDLTDSGETAVANPSLNSVIDGDSYTILLNFTGAFPPLPAGIPLISIQLTDLTHSASETAFLSGSMTINQSAGVDVFSGLGCLTDPSTCVLGNELDFNFQIPSSGLGLSGVAAQVVPGLVPSMDLLEDSSGAEVQGSITGYSATGVAPGVPEPSTISFAILGLAFLTVCLHNRKT